MQPENGPLREPSFEENLKRLEEIVRLLEEGKLGLSDGLARYEEGVKLLRQSYELLERAERRIELMSGVDAEGRPISRPFDDTATLSLEEKAQQRGHRRSAPPDPPQVAENHPSGEATDIDAPPGLF